MKMFYIMLGFMLLGALALPFFMAGPDGQPLMEVDDVLEDTLGSVLPSEPVEMYRWQDEHGVWQFTERAPDEAAAAKLTYDGSRTNSMGSEWDVTPVVNGSTGNDSVNFQMPNTLSDAYRAAPELMDAAQRAAGVMNSRQAEMDDLLGDIQEAAR